MVLTSSRRSFEATGRPAGIDQTPQRFRTVIRQQLLKFLFAHSLIDLLIGPTCRQSKNTLKKVQHSCAFSHARNLTVGMPILTERGQQAMN